MSKEILIIPSNTDLNRGDQALVWESVSVVRDALPEASFCLLESGTTPEDIHLQTRQTRALGYNVVPKLLLHPSRISKKKNGVAYSYADYALWGAQAVADLIVTGSLLVKSKAINNLAASFLTKEQRDTLERFKNAHAVIVKGGGFIHAYGKYTDYYTMYFSLFHLLLAHRYGKKVIVYPNSIGPVKGFFTSKMVKRALANCQLVTVRERVSEQYLKDDMQLKCELYPDLGFFLPPKEKDFSQYLLDRGVPLGSKKLVGITLRPYRFPKSADPKESYKNYVAAISGFVQKVAAAGCHIVFFAHTLGPSAHEDDRIAIRDVIKALPEDMAAHYSYMEDFDLDSRDMTAIYSHLDVMAGTRFHSVIFALNVNVPSIAIAYGGNKSFGIMRDMKLDDFVFPIEDFSTEQLYTAFEKAIANKQYYQERIAEYREYLNKERKKLVAETQRILA